MVFQRTPYWSTTYYLHYYWSWQPKSRHLISWGSWSEVLEFQVTNYLDVNDRLIGQKFLFNPTSSCSTVLSAGFQGSILILSRKRTTAALPSTSSTVFAVGFAIVNFSWGFSDDLAILLPLIPKSASATSTKLPRTLVRCVCGYAVNKSVP